MPGGQPSTYSPEMAIMICEQLIAGDSLRAICRKVGMPHISTVLLWLSKHEEFSTQYARAREQQMEAMAEELLEIADDSSGDVLTDGEGRELVQHEVINRARLRVDSRKWLMSKLAPKKYGDKITSEQTGPNGGPQEHIYRWQPPTDK